jgi:TPP-dependent pyruvate/acetoin dehydrogenase alpha subunit
MTPLSILTPSGAPHDGADPAWSIERVQSLHRALVRSRVIDRVVGDLQRRGLVSVFAPAHGHEAHIYGALLALRESDWLFADLRQGAAALYRGFELRGWLAQLLGTRSAAHAGHAHPTEFTARAVNFVSVSSPVGTQIIHASGTAQGMKAKGNDDCTLVWFGPAAAATGDCHVGLNFAGVARAPAIFYYCSSGDAEADAARLGPGVFADRAEGYGIRAARVDGSDVFAVYAAVAEAVRHARSGAGPTLIEGMTGGPDGSSDPLARLEGYLTSRGEDAAALRQAIDAAFEAELRDHIEDLLAEPQPDTSTIFDDVFARPTAQLTEQRDGLSSHLRRFAGGVID